MSLATLLDGIASVPAELADTEVRGLQLDSRAVGVGDVFIGVVGGSTHGAAYADAARQRGAVALLLESPLPANVEHAADTVVVPQLRQHLSALARRMWPQVAQLRVVGVTGTNGKTSNVQLLAQALSLLGVSAGSIGTLGHGLHGQLTSGERTTPDVLSVHRLLAEMHDRGGAAVAMEVSSHALDQGRVDGIDFDVAIFTNLTRDHLDYHGTMQAYGEAKARLFQWPSLQAAVVNIDDAFGASLHAPRPNVDWITVSAKGHPMARLRALEIGLSAAGLRFVLAEGASRITVRSPLLGRFNVDNLLTVAGALRALGYGLPAVATVLAKLTPVSGRMIRCGGDAGQPLVVVDYAHTPDALEQALVSLRGHTAGRLHCVFGCGGERDRGKRPQMAAIAERHADAVVVTDDNPRNEAGDAIVADIRAGFARPQAVRVERDRRRAIAHAIAAADEGDVVLIAGKGHEAYQESAGLRQPFDDVAEAQAALEARA